MHDSDQPFLCRILQRQRRAPALCAVLALFGALRVAVLALLARCIAASSDASLSGEHRTHPADTAPHNMKNGLCACLCRLKGILVPEEGAARGAGDGGLNVGPSDDAPGWAAAILGGEDPLQGAEGDPSTGGAALMAGSGGEDEGLALWAERELLGGGAGGAEGRVLQGRAAGTPPGIAACPACSCGGVYAFGRSSIAMSS